LFNYLHRYYR